jgi:CheY-like chemotaxis protein
LGAADYLVKPILQDRLVTALTQLTHRTDGSAAEARRVLIIDDTPEDLKLLRRALEGQHAGGEKDQSYQVLEASDGLEGIKIIQEQQPDLIVLDLMMPEMDGFAVLETLKSDEQMRRIPIIIVTAKELTDDERAQINGQVAALFQKGLFNADELFQDVDHALSRLHKGQPEVD